MHSDIHSHSWLQLFCNTTVRVIMILLLGWLFYLSIFGTCMLNYYLGNETTAYLTDQPFVHLSAILLIFLLGYLFLKHKNTTSSILDAVRNTHILVIVHILVAVSMLAAIFICRYQPVSDQYTYLYAAKQFLEGDFTSWQIGGDLYLHPALNGLTLLFVPFVAVFGAKNAAIAFQVFNLAMHLLASYALYRFSKSVGLRSFATSLLFILYLPFTFYCFFVYGNTASVSLCIVSLWKIADFMKEKRIRDAIISAAAITTAYLLKQTSAITLIAILIFLIVSAIIQKKPKLLLILSLYIIFMYCGNLAVNQTIEGFTHEKVSEGLSFYGWLGTGISEGEWADGWYNNYIVPLIISYGLDLDVYAVEAKNAFLQDAQEFWSDPSYFIPFLARKTASQWNNPTFQSIWIQQQTLKRICNGAAFPQRPMEFLCLDGSTSNMIFYFVFNLLQSILLFGCLCYFLFDAKRASLASLLPAITFIGGFLFLLFWEAKAQYTILFFVLLFPYAVSGYPAFLRRLIALKSDKSWYCSKEVIFLAILLLSILLFAVTDAAPISNTIKLGRDDQTLYYQYYLEQNSL